MRILAAVPLLLLAAPLSAQTAARATTEDGRRVLLYPDGKWKQTSSEDPTKIQGIPFTYYGYHFSGPQGSVQLLTYTGSNLFAEYKPEFEDFLNGLTPPAQR